MYALLIVVCPFVLFLLAIVLSVPLRYTDYDCPFGIFKLVFVLGCEIYVSYIIPVNNTCDFLTCRKYRSSKHFIVTLNREKSLKIPNV